MHEAQQILVAVGERALDGFDFDFNSVIAPAYGGLVDVTGYIGVAATTHPVLMRLEKWHLSALRSSFLFLAKPKIFIKSQAWCVLCGAGQNNGRANQVMESARKHLGQA